MKMPEPNLHEQDRDEAAPDPEKVSTPAGIAEDLEEMAEETGATADPEILANDRPQDH